MGERERAYAASGYLKNAQNDIHNDCVIRLQCRSPSVIRCGNPWYLLFPVVLTGFIVTIDNGDNFSAHATLLI